ncbi:LysE/ArgO family amino acid transporter [Aestuariimicrobium sp. T2.26MG-19.2B]|uniref:LysE/ArgO family amino acid transporter n=1 Tax=Aestuariimicrobium sp. T2.26MG-19.2B TaxID=3040679 RepID=UPI00247740AA|nr:LysE/ArgO family amino acid transporter [Aestuariimicrobium sp. T2.26MG-19.2B]CAI9403088.1 Arginine exporter protein ArgO [Aestuariimicrobium sp. T2.26MG-19.2B]
MNTSILAAVVSGLLSGLSLIVAIGAQNAFVLRQGVAKRHVGVVVAICAVSDLVLIAAGVAGVGAVVQGHPVALKAIAVVGAAYLTWFGVRSLLSARRPEALLPGGPSPRGSVVASALALTWLNPHVYLDTVLLLGNLAASHGATGRWWFGLGAGLGSILWFAGLGYGAGLAARWFSRERTWQVLDVVIGLVMFALAGSLLVSAF